MAPGSARFLLLLLAGMLAIALFSASAPAKGVGLMPSSDGVAVPGSPYRFESISPGVSQKLTVVTRIERQGGRISRWWYLRGRFQIPAVTFDPSSGGGLSADGRILVLSQSPTRTYPPRTSRFAVIDTPRSQVWHGPGRPQITHFIALRGDFSLDAISPDGATAYLSQRLRQNHGASYITDHLLRALDLASGELAPKPIVDRRAPRREEGLPISRATSGDGRWAYTLYDGSSTNDEHASPFISALDTAEGRLTSVDLPRPSLGETNLFMLRLRLEDGGRVLALRPHSADPDSQPLLQIDTRVLRENEARASRPGLSDFFDFALALLRRPDNLLTREER